MKTKTTATLSALMMLIGLVGCTNFWRSGAKDAAAQLAEENVTVELSPELRAEAEPFIAEYANGNPRDHQRGLSYIRFVESLVNDRRMPKEGIALNNLCLASITNLSTHGRGTLLRMNIDWCNRWDVKAYRTALKYFETSESLPIRCNRLLSGAFTAHVKLDGREEAFKWLRAKAVDEESIKRGMTEPRDLREWKSLVMGVYGWQSYRYIQPQHTKIALDWFKANDMKPSFYTQRWLLTGETFETFKKFPRKEKDIVFPEGPHYFGTAKGKTVRVKDQGFNATNMTAVIQKIVDDPTTGTIVFGKTAEPYRISTVKPRSNLTFVFEDGVRILADRETQEKNAMIPMFRMSNVSNIVFVGQGKTREGVRLGKYEDREERRKWAKTYGGDGFLIESGCRNIAIYNLAVSDCSMDGLLLGGLGEPPREVFVRDVIFESNHRQACSLCCVHGIYFKNVAFNDTDGNSPMCGIDIEPSIQEVQAVSEIYLFDCTFSGNRGSHLNWSCSSVYPVTLYASRCVFEPNWNGCLEFFALPGVYMFAGNDVPATSNIIFEDCRFKQFSNRHAIHFNRSSFFTVGFKNSTIEDVGPGRRSKEVVSPVGYRLDRFYGKPMNYWRQGDVTFDNVCVNGYTNAPVITFMDTAGNYSVSNIFGKVVHNGKTVDMKQFRYYAPETKLDDIQAFDAADFKPYKGELPTAAQEMKMKFQWGGQWFQHKPVYTAIYWADNAWQTRVVARNAVTNIADILDKPLAFSGKSPENVFQISAPKDGMPEGEATFYFEVPARAGECIVRVHWGEAELLNPKGEVVDRYSPHSPEAVNGAKYMRFKPTSRKSEIWALRIPKGTAHVKFFQPLTGIIAEKPEWLPRKK